nr:hypothetical protein [Saccharobesus litoralis]
MIFSFVLASLAVTLMQSSVLQLKISHAYFNKAQHEQSSLGSVDEFLNRIKQGQYKGQLVSNQAIGKHELPISKTIVVANPEQKVLTDCARQKYGHDLQVKCYPYQLIVESENNRVLEALLEYERVSDD